MFTYSTVRSASIQSTNVGIVYRIVQVILLTYIIGWELFRNKGYQSFDTVSSVVTTKVKGLGYVAINKSRDKTLDPKDPQYYKKIFAFDPHAEYKIYDTAGKNLTNLEKMHNTLLLLRYLRVFDCHDYESVIRN